MSMSLKLEEALRAWLAEPAKGHGLCRYVYLYIKDFLSVGDCTAADKATDELVAMFVAEGLCWDIPFHDSFHEYAAECEANTCHLNPKRIAWVKAKLGIQNEPESQSQT